MHFKKIKLLLPENRGPMLWLGFSLLFLGLFIKITWELQEDAVLESLDREVLVFISRFRVMALNGPMVDMTALGSPTVIGLFTMIGLALLWLINERRGCAYLAIGSVGAGIITFVMKHIFTRERPTIVPRLIEGSGFSYPSGHSLAATSFYLLLMFLAWRHFRSWQMRGVLMVCTALLIAGVCFSRLYLGAHYPSDVLSGMLLGSAWVCFLTSYFIRLGDHSQPTH